MGWRGTASAAASCDAGAVPTVSLNVRSSVWSRSAGPAGLHNRGTGDGAHELDDRGPFRPASSKSARVRPGRQTRPTWSRSDTRLTDCCGLCVRVSTDALSSLTATSSRGRLPCDEFRVMFTRVIDSQPEMVMPARRRAAGVRAPWMDFRESLTGAGPQRSGAGEVRDELSALVRRRPCSRPSLNLSCAAVMRLSRQVSSVRR